MEEIKLVINEKRSRSAVSTVIISNEVYYKVNYISNVTGNSMQDITEALLCLALEQTQIKLLNGDVISCAIKEGEKK